jgi:hypothetical protein
MTSVARRFIDEAAEALRSARAEQETGFRVVDALDFGGEAVLIARALPGRAMLGLAIDAESMTAGFDAPETAGNAWSWELREPGRMPAEAPSAKARATVELQHPGIRWITRNTPAGTFIDGT